MKRWFTVIAGVVVLAVAAAGIFAVVQRVRVQPGDRVFEASGRIEGDEVLVSSKIGGRVLQLLVRGGDAVTRGQPVAVIGSEELDARMRQADAQVAAARAQVAQAQMALEVLERQAAHARKAWTVAQVRAPIAVDEARATVRAAEADLDRARAVREEAARELARLQTLLAAGAIAQANVDAASTGVRVAESAVTAASGQVQRARAALAAAQTMPLEVEAQAESVRAAERQLDTARAALTAAAAQVQAAVAARDDLHATHEEARVYAPASGVVITRVVNAGEVVPAGTSLVTLVDMEALWLKVYIPEPELGKIRLGAPARVYVDAFPDRAFAAKVTEISQRAEFTPKDVQTREERVKQVFAVKLAVENPGGVLKPGMPADAEILWNGGSE